MATISKGIKLSYGTGKDAAEFTALTDLQEIPDLGGEVEAVEVTTLADEAHKYTDGLISYGESLAFKFLYAKELFTTLNALSGDNSWLVTLPGGETCTFNGSSSVKFDAVGVNAPLTYTLSVKPSSAMEWA